jgi:hypothetical protein
MVLTRSIKPYPRCQLDKFLRSPEPSHFYASAWPFSQNANPVKYRAVQTGIPWRFT